MVSWDLKIKPARTAILAPLEWPHALCAPLPRAVREAGTFEQSAVALAEQVFEPLGLQVRRLARVPYLSRGGPHGSILALNDALFVLTARGGA